MFAQDKLYLCYNNDVNAGQTEQYQGPLFTNMVQL